MKIIKKIGQSFLYAFTGIFASIKSERNMKIHLIITILVIIAGIYFKITLSEWITCVILIGLVLGAELFNTSIEAVIDMVMPNYHPQAKIAKDAAAGAVLVLAISAAIVGLLIFGPKLIAGLC